MAKKVTGYIKLQIPAGAATPAPSAAGAGQPAAPGAAPQSGTDQQAPAHRHRDSGTSQGQ